MKKLILILLAAVAFSCGDGSNRSSEREDDMNNNDLNNRELIEPDTTGMTDDSDTTSTWDRDRDNLDGDSIQ